MRRLNGLFSGNGGFDHEADTREAALVFVFPDLKRI